MIGFFPPFFFFLKSNLLDNFSSSLFRVMLSDEGSELVDIEGKLLRELVISSADELEVANVCTDSLQSCLDYGLRKREDYKRK